MDGNRRYARSRHQLVQEGHSAGFLALRRILELCLKLNVKCVSTYAFSIENFKRPPEEVDALMNLAEEKLLEICRHGDLLDSYGVQLNVVGKTELLPENVQLAVKKAEGMTRHNNRALLNICMPYTAQDEIATAVRDCVHDALSSRHSSQPSQPPLNIDSNSDSGLDLDSETEIAAELRNLPIITEEDITSHLMLTRAGSPPLDVLVRTSGVKRLSDFMLWQSCEGAQIYFSSSYWPEFGFWDFIPIILDYQRQVWSKRAALAVS
ncbi:hypothetical protein AMATHDRAFT_70663 [Amanita thiersii Skay4041]|uniref:Alkyl transferase n=1 Tax=Amanita thiersii Skay4041 TaxID=703135 RepID=A0A2A9NEC5_9AGAR|nr:hypothetical protein AMATHDRAFT_70663 [Amanita thiersii Skay4041]